MSSCPSHKPRRRRPHQSRLGRSSPSTVDRVSVQVRRPRPSPSPWTSVLDSASAPQPCIVSLDYVIVQNATKNTRRRPRGATDGRGRFRPVGDGRRRAETLRKPNATRQSRRGRPGEKPDETLSCTLFSVSRFPPLLSSPSVPSLGKPSSQPTQHRADLGSCSCHPLLAIAPLHHRTSSKAPFTSPRVASAPSTARQETSFPSSRPSSNPSLVFLSRPLWSPLLLGP